MSEQDISKKDNALSGLFPGTPYKRQKIYEQGLWQHGFIVLSFLIDKYANLGYYEECAIIKAVVDDISDKVGHKLPTTFDEEAIGFYKDTILELGGSTVDEGTFMDELAENALRVINKIKAIK